MHIFLLSINICPKTSRHSLNPEWRSRSSLSTARQISTLKQNSASRKKKHKSLQATQTRLETFSLVRCCSIHKGHYFQHQLNCNYPYTSSLKHTTVQLPSSWCVSVHTLHLLSHLHYVRLITAHQFFGLLSIPLNSYVQRSRKQLFRAPHLPTPRAGWSTGRIGASDALPHAPAPPAVSASAWPSKQYKQ